MTTTTGQAVGPHLPRLTLLETAEAIPWGIAAGHVVHWAVDALYYLVLQVRYGFQGFSLFVQAPEGNRWYIGTPGHSSPFTVWYLKDWWDRLALHVANFLHLHPDTLWYHQQAAPEWWWYDRHAARYVVIGVLTGVVVLFLLAKPRKHRVTYSMPRLLSTPVLALLYAIPGVAVAGVLVWKWEGLHAAGWTAPGAWGLLSNELDQWMASGALPLVLMGILGSLLFAKWATRGPADEFQWFYAGRKANRIMRERRGALASVGNFADSIVIGPPGYRQRVHYLVRMGVPVKAAGRGTTIAMTAFYVLTLAAAGYGAWLTLAGPASGAI